jgi:glucokinase
MIVGVEIGATKLQLGVCDARGNLRELHRAAVKTRTRAAILRQICEIFPQKPRGISRIGVGFGGPVDAEKGVVVDSYQVRGWEKFPLKKWFERKFCVPTVIENDANCAGLAESLRGAGRGFAKVFYTNIGSGIGGALILDGEIYSGLFGAMEIGHTKLFVNGKWRDIESLASGLAIQKRSISIIEAAKFYGAAIANAVTLLNPDVVIVGGGVSLAGEKFFKPLRKQVEKLVFPPFRGGAKIVPAALGESVVVVGAALLAAGDLVE